jgi:3-oxoacyl-[acyl-carrier protein] reductase
MVQQAVKQMTYPLSQQGKVVLVMGGAGGVGRSCARMFAQAGAHVAVTHRPGEEKAREAASFVTSLPGSNHAAFAADVGDTATLLALRDAMAARYGRLDVLVNSAGFTKPIPHADLEALNDDLIDEMFRINWRGQFATERAFAPMLKASGDGHIDSISSIAALTGNGSNIASGAVKAGIDVMTKSLARALAPEVRVMGVAPGVVDTGFVAGRGAEFNAKTALTTPLRRVASADDVAAAVLSCATHLGYSTGSTLIVDGGRAL